MFQHRRSAAARRRRRTLAAALGAAAAGVLLPDRLRLADRFPFVDAVAWRPHAASVGLVAGAALTARRRTRPAGVAVGAVAAAALAAVVRRETTRPAARPGAPGRDLTVLAFNALHGRADTGQLATLIERNVPDFVVLPEAGPDFCGKLMALVDILGYRSWTSTPPGTRDADSVTLLAGPGAGDVQVRTGRALDVPHLEATGGRLGRRTLYAVHPVAPLDPRRARIWRRELATIAGWCRAVEAPIVAGDFNATLDHPALRAALGRCRSAAAGTGRGLVGSYPTALPRWFGIQIDHVLVPAEAATSRFELYEISGSDHRAVLTTVTLPGSRSGGPSAAAADRAMASITI